MLSPECHAARLMLGLLAVPHEVRAVDGYPGRETESPAFRALSPSGILPVLEDEGATVAGVAEVLAHLCARYDAAGSWLPEAGRGPIVYWLGFATAELAVLGAARQAALFGGRGDADALRRAGWLALRRLEDQLIARDIEGAAWIVGDGPTIADIAAFPHVALSHDCGIGLEDFPALDLWQRRVRRLPGFVGMPGIPDYF